MRSAPDRPPLSNWVQRPTASVVMTYGGAIALWLMHLIANLRGPSLFDDAPFRIIDSRLYYAFSAANVGLMVWVIADALSALRPAVDVRRGQVAGTLLGLALLGVLQLGAQTLHFAWPHEGGTSPDKIEAFVSALEPDEAVIARAFVEQLELFAPEHRLACSSIPQGFLSAVENDLWFAGLYRNSDGMSVHVPRKPPAARWIPSGPWELVSSGPHAFQLDIRVAEAAGKLEDLKTAIGAVLEN